MISRELIRKQRLLLAALLALIGITAVVGAGLGYSSLSYDRLLPTLLGRGTFKEEFVLFSVRLPRIAITVLAGAALALSGALLQGVARNDLADPGILGINAGAGAAIAVFYLFVPIDARAFAFAIPLVAFAGGLSTAAAVYAFAYTRRDGLHPVKLVLSGVGLSMALSGLMVVLISASERAKVEFIAKWLAGGVWGADWLYAAAVAPWLLALVPYALYKARRLDLLALSEPSAVGIGVDVRKERASLLLAAVALASAAVSVTGGIAFVGLMAPHIARGLVGPRHRLLLPASLLIGAFLLLLADTIGRNLADPDGLPAGIIAALIGAPYFLYLLMRK